MKKLLVSFVCVIGLGLALPAQAKSVTYYPAKQQDDDKKKALVPLAVSGSAAVTGATVAVPAMVAAQGAVLGLAPLTVIGTIALGSAIAVESSSTTGTH